MTELSALFESVSVADLTPAGIARLDQIFRGICGLCKNQPDGVEDMLVRYAGRVDEVIAVLTVAAVTAPDEASRHSKHSVSILYHIFDMVTEVLLGKDNFTAVALLELVNNDCLAACSLLSGVLRFKDGSLDDHLLATRLLVELTAASSLYSADQSDAVVPLDIADLTAQYNRYVTKLLDAVISSDTVDSFGRCVCYHQRDHATTDLLVSDFCRLVTNLLSFSSDKQRIFRTHLAQSGLISDIFLPYIENVLPVFLADAVPPNRLEWKTLTGVLRLLAIVSFKIKTFRQRILSSSFFLEILEIRNLEHHPLLVLALLQLALNADFAGAPFWPEFFACLHAFVHDKLNRDDQTRIAAKLASPEPGVPMLLSAECKQSIFQLLGVDKLKEKETAIRIPDPGPATAKGSIESNDGVRSVGPESFKTTTPPALSVSHAVDSTTGTVAVLADTISNKPVAIERICASDAVCGLSGRHFSIGFRAPSGHLFEKTAIMDWLSSSSICPVNGSPLTQSDLTVVHADGEPLERKHKDETAAKEKLTLADLPPIAVSGDGSQTRSKTKIKINRNLAALEAAPSQFKCALDGKLMVNPLMSPDGYVFEKQTLERWMKSVGSVCPITEKPLKMDDCIPDRDLKKAITKWLKDEGLVGAN